MLSPRNGSWVEKKIFVMKDKNYSSLELNWEQEKMVLRWKQTPPTDSKWLATFNSAHFCSDKVHEAL